MQKKKRELNREEDEYNMCEFSNEDYGKESILYDDGSFELQTPLYY